MVSNRVTLLARLMQCFLFFFSFTFQPMFRDNNEKRDWTVLGHTTSHMYDHWQDFRPQNRPSTALDKKKEPCCWCIKSESCDIEESECLIQLRNRERTRLATAATSCIDANSDCRFFDITWCITKMVLFFSSRQYMYKTYLCNLQSLSIWAIFNPGAIQTSVVVHRANKKFLTKVDIFTLTCICGMRLRNQSYFFMQKFKVKLQPPPQMTYI